MVENFPNNAKRISHRVARQIFGNQFVDQSLDIVTLHLVQTSRPESRAQVLPQNTLVPVCCRCLALDPRIILKPPVSVEAKSRELRSWIIQENSIAQREPCLNL